MKKMNLLLLIIFICAETSFAQIRRGAMEVSLRDNKMLTIVLDGRHFRKYGSSLTIGDLPQGMHELKVYYFYPANDPKYRNFRDNRAHAALIYKGRIHIDGGMMYYCTVDPAYKSLSIRESRTISINDDEPTYPINTESEFSDDKNFSDIDERSDRRRDDRNEVLSYYRKDNLMTASQLATLRTAVEDRISSADKTEVIEQYVSSKSLMTDQVITMMSWLSFESNKLEIAKSCFSKVLDPENYLLVSNKLSFQSSKRELETIMYAKNERLNKRDNNWNEGDEDDYDNRGNANRNVKPMSNKLQQNQMNTLAASVREKIADSDKQKLMQQYLDGGATYTTNQLKTMLDWLTFEGSRLEFVKWSYNRISDPENFLQIKSKFSFSSSKKTIDDMALKGK